jgi:hypothetical protein
LDILKENDRFDTALQLLSIFIVIDFRNGKAANYTSHAHMPIYTRHAHRNWSLLFDHIGSNKLHRDHGIGNRIESSALHRAVALEGKEVSVLKDHPHPCSRFASHLHLHHVIDWSQLVDD